MKIIGKQNGDFIAVITEYEICCMMGFKSTYEKGWKEYKEKFGETYRENANFEQAEIDISKLHSKVFALREKEDDAKKAIGTLRNLADALEIAWPSLTLSIKEEK